MACSGFDKVVEKGRSYKSNHTDPRMYNAQDSTTAPPEDIFYNKPKIVDRVFALPMVSDTYTLMASLASPFQPMVKSTVTSLDNMACSGFDKVVEKVPCLQQPVPDYQNTVTS